MHSWVTVSLDFPLDMWSFRYTCVGSGRTKKEAGGPAELLEAVFHLQGSVLRLSMSSIDSLDLMKGRSDRKQETHRYTGAVGHMHARQYVSLSLVSVHTPCAYRRSASV